MTSFSTKNAVSGLGKIQGSVKLLVLHFFLLICTVLEVNGLAVQFVESDKLKIIQTPKYLKICHKSDPNFNECLKSSLDTFMKSVNKGSSELEVPSIDPVVVPFLEFDEGITNFTCHVVLKSLSIRGFKDIEIIQVKSNLEENKFGISLKAPRIDINTNVISSCNLYSFPLPVEGDFSMNLTNFFALYDINLDVYENQEDHLNYFKVASSRMAMVPLDVDMDFQNFIDNSVELENEFHGFLKKNSHELFMLIRPITQKILANVLGAIADEVLSRHPQQTLLPD